MPKNYKRKRRSSCHHKQTEGQCSTSMVNMRFDLLDASPMQVARIRPESMWLVVDDILLIAAILNPILLYAILL